MINRELFELEIGKLKDTYKDTSTGLFRIPISAPLDVVKFIDEYNLIEEFEERVYLNVNKYSSSVKTINASYCNSILRDLQLLLIARVQKNNRCCGIRMITKLANIIVYSKVKEGK